MQQLRKFDVKYVKYVGVKLFNKTFDATRRDVSVAELYTMSCGNKILSRFYATRRDVCIGRKKLTSSNASFLFDVIFSQCNDLQNSIV